MVDAAPGARAVVAFGDSITDGDGSTVRRQRPLAEWARSRPARGRSRASRCRDAIIRVTVSAWGSLSTSRRNAGQRVTPSVAQHLGAGNPLVEDGDRAPAGLYQAGASTFGQRSLPSTVEPSPSVIESPNATTARAPGAASTMTSLTKSRETMVESDLKSAAPVWSPLTMKAVS